MKHLLSVRFTVAAFAVMVVFYLFVSLNRPAGVLGIMTFALGGLAVYSLSFSMRYGIDFRAAPVWAERFARLAKRTVYVYWGLALCLFVCWPTPFFVNATWLAFGALLVLVIGLYLVADITKKPAR